MAALVAALWAYDGWNDLNMVGGEIRDPGRNIPIALIAGVATVAGLYMLTNAAVQYVLPAAAIAASPRPASEATAVAVGLWGAAIVSAGMAISMLVALNGTIMSGARVPFALARDGYFFKAMAEVHPRFHTPSVALLVQLALSMFLLLFAGNFRQLFSLAIFAEWLFYMITASAVFVLRRKEPNAARPYPYVGISHCACNVRCGRRRAAVLHIHAECAELGLGSGRDSGRSANLFVFCEEEEGRLGLGVRGWQPGSPATSAAWAY